MRIISWAVFAIVAVAGIFSIVRPALPDAAVSAFAARAAVTSSISAWLHGPVDAFDAFGWAGWANHAAFAYASMGFYAFAVPLAKLFGDNGVAAVRILQVCALLLGWISAAALYRKVRGRTPWALVAGGFYALLPWQIAIVRGDPVAGLLVATIPLAAAATFEIVRRWGMWALPLSAAIVALATVCVAGELGIAAAVLLFCCDAAAAFEKAAIRRWIVFVVLAAIFGASVTAYFVFPTLAYQMWASIPAYEIFKIGNGFYRGCWDALQIAAALVLAFALGVGAERLPAWQAARSWAPSAVTAGLYALLLGAFAIGGGFSGNQTVPPSQMRATAALDRLAAFRGGRVANASDWPLYGASAPYSEPANDLARRYLGDGLDGAGVLARANVTTFVTGTGSAALALQPASGTRYIRSAIQGCISGGMKFFDQLAVQPVFADVAFFAASPCPRTIFVDSGPPEQVLGGTLVESFTAKQLLPNAKVVARANDPSASRFRIADQSYDVGADGYPPQISGAAAPLDAGSSASSSFETSKGPWLLAMSAACHATVRGHVTIDASYSLPFSCAPHPGFSWFKFPLRNPSPGLHEYSLTLDSVVPDPAPTTTWKFAFDGFLLLSTAKTPALLYDSGFVFSQPGNVQPRWIASGRYRAYRILRDGRDVAGTLRFDQRASGDILNIPNAGWHELQWVAAPNDALLLALVPTSWRTPLPNIRVRQTAGDRWSIVVKDVATVEAAVLPDGNWQLYGAGDPPPATQCDVQNVCFPYVPAGTWELRHPWPEFLPFGFGWTILAWILAAVILLNEIVRRRGFRVTAEPAVARPATYFWFVGWSVAVVVAITYINWVRQGAYGWMFASQLAGLCAATFVAGVGTIEYGRYAVLARKPGWIGPWVQWMGYAGVAFATLGALALDAADHRRFVLVIAVAQSLAVAALHRHLPKRAFVWLALSAFISWSLVSGLTFTHLGDLLFDASPSTGLVAAAFVCGFALVVFALRQAPSGAESDRSRLLWFAAAATLFACSALRTDNLGTEWIPIHRSYFADVTQMVRDGHWLLWDVPSLYGFLSILTLSLVPAKNGYQAVYELTALFLTTQACIAFVILRWGNASRANAILALLLPIATFFNDGISRYPWSARLYPQGGLRFFWTDALVFVIFLSYAWRERPRRVAALQWIGHVFWAIALFWSIETGVWATAVWVSFLALQALATSSATFSPRAALPAFLRSVWPMAVLPAAGIAIVELFYRARLGHPPDWIAFVEFLGLFTTGIRSIFHVQYLGSAWTILLVLGALGTLGIVSLRERRYALVPLLGATWMAVCSTASYWALEPIDMYVSLLLTVLVPASAVAIFASREGFVDGFTALLSRYSLAPLAIVAIATLFGEASHLQAMRFPFTPGWHFDVTRDEPPISGELADLLARAGVTPQDALIVPNGLLWTEPQQGIIQPYVRLGNGDVVEYHTWLPESPAGESDLFQGLSAARQQTYVDRFLDRSHAGGWYVTYRQPADCTKLSPRLSTTRKLSSPNFSIALCELER